MYFDVLDGERMPSYEEIARRVFAPGDHVHVLSGSVAEETLYICSDAESRYTLWGEFAGSRELLSPYKAGLEGTSLVFDGQDATPVPNCVVLTREMLDEILQALVATGHRDMSVQWTTQSVLYALK